MGLEPSLFKGFHLDFCLDLRIVSQCLGFIADYSHVSHLTCFVLLYFVGHSRVENNSYFWLDVCNISPL